MKKLIASLFIALGIMTVPQQAFASATTDAALLYGLGTGFGYIANVKAQQNQLKQMKYYNNLYGSNVRSGYNNNYGYNNTCMIYCSTGGIMPVNYGGYGYGYGNAYGYGNNSSYMARLGGYGYGTPYQYSNAYGYGGINSYYQPLFTTITDTSYIYRFYTPSTTKQTSTVTSNGYVGNDTNYSRPSYSGFTGSTFDDYTKSPSNLYTDGLVGESTDYIRNSTPGLSGGAEDYSRAGADYSGGLYGDSTDYVRDGGLTGGLEDYTR
jgi:hypothetical protein